MGARTDEKEMRVGQPIFTIMGMLVMIVLIAIIFYTIHQFRLRGYRIEQEIRRSSMAVFYTSFLLAFLQVLLWGGIFTTLNDCDWIVKINVITIQSTKMCLYYLYTVRLDYTFRGTDWEMAPIILFFIRIAIVLVFGIVSVIMIVEIHPGNAKIATNWGIYCNIQLASGVLYVYGTIDFLITSYLLYLFSSRLLKVSTKVGETLSKKDNALYHLVRLITVLTFLSIISSWVITFGYALYKPLAWFTSLDALFNALCVFLMFEFVHIVDRVRYGGILCVLCTCCWPKSARSEFDEFMLRTEEQLKLDLQTSSNNNNNQNNPNNTDKNNNNNKNNPNNGNNNNNTNNNNNQNTNPNTNKTKEYAVAMQQQSNQRVAENTSGDTTGTAGSAGTGAHGSPVANPNLRRVKTDSSNNIEIQVKLRSQNAEKKSKKPEDKEFTTTSDLDMKSKETTVNDPEQRESTIAEWTLASDVVTDDKQNSQLETELVGDDGEKQQADQYAMEIMQLHANIDRF